MRKTKIIATLGPATESPEMLRKMIYAGVNIFRLNMSHGNHDWTRRAVKEIRAAAADCGRSIGILMDTQGPAIRIGDLPAPLQLKPGDKFTFTVRGEKSNQTNSVSVNYDEFVDDIQVGKMILVDNGAMQMMVLSKSGNSAECEVLTAGKLSSRKHINLPGVKVSLPAMTEKDKADVEVGLELQVDYIALSFVREARDVRELKKLVDRPGNYKPMIVAKIEDQEAVKNLEAIVRDADAIMVARGDLGIEVPYEELPIIQRRAVKICLRIGRPVIVATHILESMIESPMPTRAEVTDAANIVFEQADSLMLSGETTIGKYPLQCVEVFDRIAKRIEHSGGANYWEQAELTDPREKIAKSAVVMANELRAEAIITFVRRGTMTRYLSWLRPRYSMIYAVGQSPETGRQLTLNWGVQPLDLPVSPFDSEANIELTFKTLIEKKCLRPGNTVVILSYIQTGQQIVYAVQTRIV